jgi:DNA topoisomerase-2
MLAASNSTSNSNSKTNSNNSNSNSNNNNDSGSSSNSNGNSNSNSNSNSGSKSKSAAGEGNNDLSSYTVKYYKGLGTNTAEEGKEYFRSLSRHKKDFYSGERSAEAIDLAFSGTRAEDRRNWLLSRFDPHAFIDPATPRVAYEEFIDKELIQFSHADNQRSIPSVIDGLKPSQRKVLYGCFKRNLQAETKVVQLAGYIAEKTCYHHGETSLHSTIVHMAQDFVGANNVPLLVAAGQFGTRAQVSYTGWLVVR